MKRLIKNKTIWILGLLYIAAVIVRLYKLNDASIYSDEISWIVRGKEVIYAIIHGNIGYFIHGWWTDTRMTEAIGLPLTFLSGIFHVIFAGAGKYSLNFFSDIFAARLPVVLVGSLLPVAIYYFGAVFFSRKLALISSLIYIFNPISMALDRWVVHDSFLTFFSFMALVSYIYYSKKKVINILPGIFLALAFLTKPNGVLPMVGWLVYVIFTDRSAHSVKNLFLNLLTFFLAVTLLWPASWNRPILAIFEYLFHQFRLVGQTSLPVYYRGALTNNPGFEFYIFQYLIRMPVVLLAGFFIGIFFWLRIFFGRITVKRDIILPIVSYALVFFLLISFSNQKLGIRYALPLLPWFVIFSAWGLLLGIRSIHNNYFKALVVGFITLGILAPLAYNPDYYLYYNSLAGGPKGAQKYDMVGFCSSTRLAAIWLGSLNIKGGVYVAGCTDPVRYYANLNLVDDYKKADYIILETYLVNQYPESEVIKFLATKSSWKDFQEHGAVIARIYKQN